MENKEKRTVTATEEKKPAKWVLSKAVKIDAFERMLEQAWADSRLKDESILKEVHDKLAKWYRLDSASPLAGYSKYNRPQSQEELEKQMYEDIDMHLSKYDGYMEGMDMVRILREQDMEQILQDEKLEKAEWEYFYSDTYDSPYAEATATINDKKVVVGYMWDEQHGRCYVHVNGFAVRDRGVCNHCCEVVGKAIGRNLTGLSFWLWESWVEYHGLYDGWEDMGLGERYGLYKKAIVQR